MTLANGADRSFMFNFRFSIIDDLYIGQIDGKSVLANVNKIGNLRIT